MVEKKVNVCDFCKEKVAKTKCDICSKDTCEDCQREKMIGSMVPFIKYNLCSLCEDKIQIIAIDEPAIFEEVLENKPEVKAAILDAMKNIIILKKISDEDVPTRRKKLDENKLFESIIPPNYKPYNPPRPYGINGPPPFKPYYTQPPKTKPRPKLWK